MLIGDVVRGFIRGRDIEGLELVLEYVRWFGVGRGVDISRDWL